MSEDEDHFQESIYSMSHDLVAPLRRIDSFSRMLSHKYGDLFDDKAKTWLDFISRDVDKMQLMIERMHEYAQLSSVSAAQKPIDLKQVCLSIMATSTIKDFENTDCIELVGDLPTVRGIALHWHMLIRELLANSLCYQPKGAEPKIKISFVEQQDSAVVRVEDNGIGVETKQFDQLTLLFKRLVSEQDYPGVGMGLCCVERILQLQGGQLIFGQSSLGGLQVDCYFPRNLVQSAS